MLRHIIASLCLFWSSTALGQGVIPLALAQQQDINGRPLAGALLYIFQVGTVATPQDTFPDVSLNPATKNQWPLQADTTGRIPMFYVADGFVHARLTDSFGVVQFDVANMQVTGPSSGGGGGGGGSTIDPTTIAAVGDIKFRMTGETLTGWVKLNGQTIGNAASGANTASDGLLNLYVYLWTNCNQAHCPIVSGMRGVSALADFNSATLGRMILPDWRGRAPVGLDDMGAPAAGRIAGSNVTSGGGDGPTTLFATGGAANHTMTLADLIQHNHTLTDPGHKHTITSMRVAQVTNTSQTFGAYSPTAPTTSQSTDVGPGTFGGDPAVGTQITIAPAGSASPTPFNTMSPFILGSWYIKL